MNFYGPGIKPSMIDSRERNSADGSLVQKARRQVEIFQSQENSGRSFQVVKASQWSSSRATDCGFDIPIGNKPNNTHFDDGLSNGSASLLSPRLSLWRSSLSNGASDLDQLSCLCRKLHNEALNTTNQLWSLRNAALRSPSPLSLLEAPSSPSPTFQEIEAGPDSNLDDRLSSSSFGERRSNSTEDVSSLLNVDDAFARDCKTRRSLQIANSENGRVNYSQSGEGERGRRARQEFIAERARRFEEGVRRANEATTRKNFISTKSFTPIANNDFVRNDPKHPSKFNQVAKISIQDNGQNGQSSPVLARRFSPVATRKANNKTVVHLRNVASPTSSEPPRCINVTAIKLENDSEQAANNENAGLYGMLMDTSSAPKEKPVKKVEFCKTEIHFAADSGKVNIVETDGKPPPTNKFRRRRRKDGLSAANGNTQKNNMPLVHFGDTSYEKYIFGGQGKPPQEMNNKTALLGENPAIDEPAKKYDPADLELKRERWNSPEKIRENGVNPREKDRAAYDDAGVENGGKHRGTHTTTVNFLKDESNAVAVPKVAEDKPGNCFSSANHVAHKEIGNLSKRSVPKQQSLPEDPDKNQVLLKIVTTHKPMLARVENDHSPNNSLHRPRLKPLDPQEESQSPVEQGEQRRGSPSVLASTDLETKDNCDNSNGVDESDCDEAPTYENIFDAVSNGDPVYENFQSIKSEPVLKAPIEKVPVVKKRPPSSQSEKSVTSSYDRRHKKLSSKLSNGSNVEESSEKARVIKTERAKTPISTKSEKNTLRSVSDDRSKSSSRLSGSRDNSIKRYKDGTKPTKDDTARGTQAKRKNSPKVGSVVQEHKGTPVINAEKNDGSIRSKKPVEVVYQTAVFNMKNEKLSKPSKGKEIKGPRLINDLICGSKLRRPSDSKKAIKTAIVSQNTSKRKETPTTMNRQ